MKDILIVDNDQDTVEAVQTLLSLLGHNVWVANNYDELIFSLQRNKPDTIILDVMLGMLDSRMICKELKTKPQHEKTKIILFSASPEKLNHHQQYLADAILKKPFEVERLLEII